MLRHALMPLLCLLFCSCKNEPESFTVRKAASSATGSPPQPENSQALPKKPTAFSELDATRQSDLLEHNNRWFAVKEADKTACLYEMLTIKDLKNNLEWAVKSQYPSHEYSSVNKRNFRTKEIDADAVIANSPLHVVCKGIKYESFRRFVNWQHPDNYQIDWVKTHSFCDRNGCDDETLALAATVGEPKNQSRKLTIYWAY